MQPPLLLPLTPAPPPARSVHGIAKLPVRSSRGGAKRESAEILCLFDTKATQKAWRCPVALYLIMFGVRGGAKEPREEPFSRLDRSLLSRASLP